MAVISHYEDSDILMHHSLDSHPCQSDYPMHAHEKHELFYFMRGRGWYYVEGTGYRLTPGSLLLMRAGETHHLLVSDDHPYERVAIHFAPAVLRLVDPTGLLDEALLNRPLGRRNHFQPGEYREELVRGCLGALAEYEPSTHGAEERLRILSCLYSVLFELRGCFDSPKDEQPPIADGTITEVLDYINRHLTDPFNLDKLSARFHISKSYLNSRFRQVNGATIWEYTIIKRLMKARERILEGMPTMEAALVCGWNDYTAFYRRYKTQFGASPSADKANSVTR